MRYAVAGLVLEALSASLVIWVILSLAFAVFGA